MVFLQGLSSRYKIRCHLIHSYSWILTPPFFFFGAFESASRISLWFFFFSVWCKLTVQLESVNLMVNVTRFTGLFIFIRALFSFLQIWLEFQIWLLCFTQVNIITKFEQYETQSYLCVRNNYYTFLLFITLAIFRKPRRL